MLADMSTLNDFPEINIPRISCREFWYAVDQVWKISYKVITDKVTEITQNRDTKAPSGTIKFSANPKLVEKWEINALYWESLRRVFHQHLQYKFSKYDLENL